MIQAMSASLVYLTYDSRNNALSEGGTSDYPGNLNGKQKARQVFGTDDPIGRCLVDRSGAAGSPHRRACIHLRMADR
jgi:hypothetical protein